MAAKKQQAYDGLALRAQRDARLAGWPDARQQAEHHEAMLLKGIGNAQDAFDWIVEHTAWTDLGFASVVDWWAQRVRPVMVKLEMRPTADMADKLLAIVREAERALPRAQRRTQAELAELALVSEWRVRGRTDSRNRRSAAGADLGNPAGPIETKLTGQAAAAGEAADGEPHGVVLADAGSSAGSVDVRVVDGPGLPETAAAANRAAADGGHVQPPATGPGALPEADRPGPVVTPDFTDEESAGVVPGVSSTEEDTDAGTSDSSAPPAAGVPAGGAGTGLEAGPPAASSPVLDPCTRIVQALEELAEEYEALDVDVLGPLLTADQLAGIDNGLNRVVAIVELLIRWNERAKA